MRATYLIVELDLRFRFQFELLAGDTMTNLGWPTTEDEVETHLGTPLKAVLADLSMGTSEEEKAGLFAPHAPSVSTIESGMTAGSKLLSALVALLGGGSAVALAVSNFWNSESKSVQTGVVLAFGSVVVATVLAIAIIIGADLRARGTAMAGLYQGRSIVAKAYMAGAQSAGGSAATTTQAATSPSAQDVATLALVTAIERAPSPGVPVKLTGGGTAHAHVLRLTSDGRLQFQHDEDWTNLTDVVAFGAY